MMGSARPDALGARPHALPPPDDEEVERLLRTVALRVVGLLRKQGKLEGTTTTDHARYAGPLSLGLLTRLRGGWV
jgi:hypothetical protein